MVLFFPVTFSFESIFSRFGLRLLFARSSTTSDLTILDKYSNLVCLIVVESLLADKIIVWCHIKHRLDDFLKAGLGIHMECLFKDARES